MIYKIYKNMAYLCLSVVALTPSPSYHILVIFNCLKGQFYLMEFNVLKENFFRNLNILKNFRGNIPQYPPLTNHNLAAAANRVTIPHVFKPFQHYIENTLGRPVNLDLKITSDDVRTNDESQEKQFKVVNFSLKNINIDYLLMAASQSLKDLGLYGKTVETIDYDTSRLSFPGGTSACYPLYGNKKADKNVDDINTWVPSFLANPNIVELMCQPCTVFHRFRTYLSDDLSENKVKSRPVWGFPFRISVLEGMLFKRLLDKSLAFTSSPLCRTCATGKTKLEISNDVIRRLRFESGKIYALDYSRFDSTIPSYMWALFYATVEPIIGLSPLMKKVFNLMMLYHNYTPYCLRNTFIQNQGQGNASGSMITTIFNNFVNRTMLNYATLERTHGKYFCEDNACVLGDDCVLNMDYFGTRHLLDVFKRFGIVVNVEKSLLVENDGKIPFAGYLWDYPDNAPTQTLPWFVSHLCVPGKFYRNSPIPVDILQTYRAITICSGVKDGIKVFEYLIGNQDRVWVKLKEDYYKGLDPMIQYIGGKERILYLSIPLHVILNSGWKAF